MNYNELRAVARDHAIQAEALLLNADSQTYANHAMQLSTAAAAHATLAVYYSQATE